MSPYPSPRVLLIGAHGKVALHMIPRLVALSWTVIALIRDPGHTDDIFAAADAGPGNVEIYVADLYSIKSEATAQEVLDDAAADYVLWAAGAHAGEAGTGPSQTLALDRDACQYFIAAACHTPRIARFLLLSTINARNAPAPWWSPDQWATIEASKIGLQTYVFAKQAADSYFTTKARERIAREEKEEIERGSENQEGKEKRKFQYIGLRPTWLSQGKGKGTAELGRTRVGGGSGTVSREDVADVAVRLLMRSDTRGWWDMVDGDVEVGEGIQKYVMEGQEVWDEGVVRSVS